MQLTYRGIPYNKNFQTQTTQTVKHTHKYRLSEAPDSNKIAWVKPVKYYTYRGVSYLKFPLVNSPTKLLK